MNQTTGGGALGPVGPSLDVVDAFPPTATQGGMLVNALRDPARGVELEQLIIRMGARIDLAKLREAFAEAQQRFEVLRGAFRWDGDHTLLEVARSAPLPFETSVLAGSTGVSDDALEHFLAEDRRRGFEPTRPPLFRVTLLRAAQGGAEGGAAGSGGAAESGEDVLVFTFHHAILDGRSYRIVIERVLDTLDGVMPADDAKRPSFGTYCRTLAAHDFGPSRAYFAKALEGASTTPLPLPRPQNLDREDVPERHAESTLVLPDIGPLIALKEAHDISVANAVQAAWAWVLARSGRVDDVVFATTRAGRLPSFPGAEHVVGCLIDTLPLRIAVDEQATALSLLRGVRAQNLVLRAHEHTPLTEVLASAGLSLGSLVVVERYDLDATQRARGGANARRRFSLRERSDFPLVLAAYQDETRLRLVLEHDENAMDREEAELLLRRVARALHQLAGHGETPLGRLELFVEGEEAKVRAWSRGPLADAVRDLGSITTRFVEVARARRDAVAVRDARGGELTYRELLERSRRIAGALAVAGATHADVVLVLLPRSIHWIAAMWGVWHADAIYVPLDPAWPEHRLTQVHDDIVQSGTSKSLVAIVDRHTRELGARALPRARIVEIDEVWDHPLPPATAEHDRPEADGADSIAYLLYTSGTTGKPKGARISHRALAAHALASIASFGLGEHDRVLQFTSLGFDVSLEEVVPTLLAGGRIVLRSDRAAQDLDVFVDEVGRAGATVLNLPSAFFHELVLYLERAQTSLPRAVRLLLVGGERPSPESYARFAQLQSATKGSGTRALARFVNAYGPTEVTVTSVTCDTLLAGVLPDGRTEIPIGRAFGSCRAHVVAVPETPSRLRREGDRLSLEPPEVSEPRLATIEEPGELWLSGPQVARGYLARPDATARSFVPDPFAEPQDLDRISYRTGDLVKTTARGQLVFLGRIDRQIKLRGHRIEPSEIESVLLRHAGVRDAAVVLAGETDSRALVGFVTSTGATLDAVALRDSLSRSLPSVMVPTLVVILPELPLAPTGKIDREQLAARGNLALRDVARTSAEGPRNDVEAWLRPIFAAVLGRDDVDLEQSFFEMGGHSLLAIRLLARLSADRPDLQLTLGMLFASPSVRGLARAIAQTSTEPVPTLVRLNPRRGDIEDEIPLFCVCGVQLYGALAHAMESDRPVFGAFLPIEAQAISGDGTELDVVSMASAYVELIRRERPRGPYLLGGVSFGGLLAYEMAQQLSAQGEEVRLLVLFDTILPRALQSAPLADRARAALHKLVEHPDQFVAALRRRVERMGDALHVTHPAARGGENDERIRDGVLKHAGEAYDEKLVPYGGPVVIFRARGGIGYEGEAVRWDLGWSSLVRPDTAVHGVDGDHLGILREPGVSDIAQALRAYLARG